MTPHNFCLALLNHEVSQALACGKSLQYSHSKILIQIFGALHLFVVSGTHLNFIQKGIQSLKFNKTLELASLGFFVAVCNFSAPVTRVYLQAICTQQKFYKFPKPLNILISCLFTLPLSFFLNQFFSLALSFLFGVILYMLKKTTRPNLFIYILAFPVFLSTLGLPHYSSLLMLPFFTLFITLALPLSLAGLFIKSAESFVIQTWWFLEDVLRYLHVFYNYPIKQQSHFTESSHISLFLYGFLLLSITYYLEVMWKRHSYSF